MRCFARVPSAFFLCGDLLLRLVLKEPVQMVVRPPPPRLGSSVNCNSFDPLSFQMLAEQLYLDILVAENQDFRQLPAPGDTVFGPHLPDALFNVRVLVGTRPADVLSLELLGEVVHRRRGQACVGRMMSLEVVAESARDRSATQNEVVWIRDGLRFYALGLEVEVIGIVWYRRSASGADFGE